MIRHFEPTELFETEAVGSFQWGPALCAGLISGIILMLLPRGSPWSGISPYIPVIMGRALPTWFNMPLPLVWVTHLAVAEVYGLIISWFIQKLPGWRAVLIGLALGILLYVLNLGVVSVIWPALRGAESAVLFTHIVFGLMAGASYRGLLRRRIRHVAG